MHQQPAISRSTMLRASRSGLILYFVLATLAALSVLAGSILLRVSSSYRAIHRAANWQQAITTANSGLDIAFAQLTAALPDVRVTPEELVGLSMPAALTSSLDLGISLKAGASGLPLGLTTTITPPPLINHGEGNTSQSASLSIEVVPLVAEPSALLGLTSSELGLQVIRVKSTGVAFLDSSSFAGYEPAENALRKPVLVWDKSKLQLADRPYVSRTVEALLRPVLAFQTGIHSIGELRVDNSLAVFDSFNSVNPLYSTAGLYDPLKRLSNTRLQTNGAQLTLPATVYGSVYTNGASFSVSVTGEVDNERYSSRPSLRNPTWTGSAGVPVAVTEPTTVSAGSALIPSRYKFTSIASELHVTRGLLGLGTHVEIWVTGDFTGSLVLDAGVKAKVYVEGDIATIANAWQNGSHLAANLQIYGLKPQPGKGMMSFSLNTDMEACIYAPEHALVFSGGGNFSGSVTGASVWIKSSSQFHYDEAVALNTGPMLSFEIVQWHEVVAK